MVRDRAKFTIGVVGLVTFFVALTIWLSPVMEDQTGLQWADNFFNQLSKSSSHFIPKVSSDVDRYRGKRFEAEVSVKDPVIAARIARLFSGVGSQAKASAKTVSLKGDLGAVARAVIEDAEVMYQDKEPQLQDKYGFSGREVIFCWWTALDAIYQHFLEAGEVGTSNFASALKTKVCEPAYNFAGITPRNASEAGLPLFALLAFYIVYTVWYGFSILYLFEGLGITAQARRREEQ